MPARPDFHPREPTTVRVCVHVRTHPDQMAQRAGVATNASRKMVECEVEHLDDGAKGNAGQAKADEVGVLCKY
jgi:hypothetical protein